MQPLSHTEVFAGVGLGLGYRSTLITARVGQGQQ